MEWKSVSRIATIAIPVVAICGFLVAGSSARVDRERLSAHDDGDKQVCTDRTLRGEYGFALQGEILGPSIQLRGVVLQKYDGRGNFTQVDHIVENGMPPATDWRPGSGTYSVNPDCTGSAVITIPGDPGSPVTLHFVVVNQGKKIQQVVDSNSVTAVGNKVD